MCVENRAICCPDISIVSLFDDDHPIRPRNGISVRRNRTIADERGDAWSSLVTTLSSVLTMMTVPNAPALPITLEAATARVRLAGSTKLISNADRI